MIRFQYKGLQVRQTRSDKMIVLFAAPATEIDQWAGVPRKKKFDDNEETVGFQREENPQRINSLGTFCSDNENVIQNPLLCATRKLPISTVRFEPSQGQSGDSQEGTIVIEIPDYNTYSMEDILGHVRDYVEARVPELKQQVPSEIVIAELKARAAAEGHLPTEGSEFEAEAQEGEGEADADAEAALFEESHIFDFWQELAGRHEVIKLLETEKPRDSFLGFTRAALESYLRPVVLVDGQHRLRGTLLAVHSLMDREDIQSEIEKRVGQGEPADAVHNDIVRREVRRLPVSLLLVDDPAEQVFQFVVVNQKATPIGRALLGTIVSTTLSSDEMSKVATRLKAAGIQLEESQAITYLARHPHSPFSGLVERGLAGDSKDLLQWNVFASLIGIFRDLKGGNLFGYKNDYAEVWRSRYLNGSGVVSGYDGAGFGDAFSYWRKIDGPWRDIFMAFFTRIRDKLADAQTLDAHNYWGSPRQSNLFNKISLTILAADFFQFLVETAPLFCSEGSTALARRPCSMPCSCACSVPRLNAQIVVRSHMGIISLIASIGGPRSASPLSS
jgi:hypothetical protein